MLKCEKCKLPFFGSTGSTCPLCKGPAVVIPEPPRMTEDEFLSRQIELLDKLPSEFRSWASSKAYEDGHSGGREEVLGVLQGLVSGLPEVISKYTDRVTSQVRELQERVLYLESKVCQLRSSLRDYQCGRDTISEGKEQG